MHITGGKFNSRKLISPKGENVRPTLAKTRAAIFDVLQQFLDFEGKIFLDMFAGSGIMGLEAVSRGFKKSIAIEKDKKTFLNIKANYELLGINPEVIWGNSLKKLITINQKFDVIYVDPPYHKKLYNPALVSIIAFDVMAKNGIIIVEHPEDEDINFCGFAIIKQKKYSNKLITYLKKVTEA